MTNYTFDSDAEGFAATGFNPPVSWDGFEGNPAGSLLFADGAFNAIKTGLSIDATEGDPVSFQVRCTSPDFDPESYLEKEFNIALTGTGVTITSTNTYTPAGYPFDSGWLTVTGEVAATGTITAVSLSITSGDTYYNVWFDNVYISEEPPAGPDFGLTVSVGGIPGSILATGPDRAATIVSVTATYTPAVPGVQPSNLDVDVEVSAPTWVNIRATGGTNENQPMTGTTDTFSYTGIPATGTVTVYNYFDSDESGSDTWP